MIGEIYANNNYNYSAKLQDKSNPQKACSQYLTKISSLNNLKIVKLPKTKEKSTNLENIFSEFETLKQKVEKLHSRGRQHKMQNSLQEESIKILEKASFKNKKKLKSMKNLISEHDKALSEIEKNINLQISLREKPSDENPNMQSNFQRQLKVKNLTQGSSIQGVIKISSLKSKPKSIKRKILK